MTDYTPLPGGRRRLSRLAAMVAGGVFAAAGLVGLGMWWAPGSVDAAPGGADAGVVARSPHGPERITEGVPSGFSRDEWGAASAAASLLQVCWAAASGAVDAARVRAVMVAADASPAVLELAGPGRAGVGAWGQQLSPVGVRVERWEPDRAVVSVWAVSLYGAETGSGAAATSAAWLTATVALVWRDGDWRTVDVRVVEGPDPNGAGDRGWVPLPAAVTVFSG